MEGQLCVPQFLYLPIHQWTFKLFPYLDYRENFGYAHEGADIVFISVFVSSGFDLSLYLKSYMDYMIVLIFRNLYRVCIIYIPTKEYTWVPFSSNSCHHFFISYLYNNSHSDRCEVIPLWF